MAIDFDSAMTGLFSAAVVALGGDPSGLKDDLHPAERVLVERAVAKRRLDFVAGRSLARRALSVLGCDEMPLLAGARREPLWPEGIVGSITHTRGFCAVAVARSDRVRGLGLDVERADEVREELKSHIATDDELDELTDALGGERALALALAFSGREAFYKFQYPLSRQWVGLRDVKMRVRGDAFVIVPNLAVVNVCPQGREIEGRYRFFGDYVLTSVEVGA